MKKSISLPVVAMCVISMYSCEEVIPEQKPESIVTVSVPYPDTTEYATITFSCQGFEMDQKAMTRGELSADGKTMTDVWILDYMGDELVQQLHQDDNTAEDFGSPTMSLAVGQHNIYFIASRGQSPTLNTTAKTLTFSKVLDTFYKSLSLDVSATSAGSQSVTLERIVTKLKLTFEDVIPANAATFNVTPTDWHYGIDYTTGQPTAAVSSQTVSMSVPSSSLGKTGEFLNLYGFSSATEWTTDIAFNCKASDNSILGAATITAAPMKRNRITSYTGPLFSGNSAMTLALSSDWLTEYTGTW